MIIICTREELVGIIADLVKRGLTFRAFYTQGNWEIELTGGY